MSMQRRRSGAIEISRRRKASLTSGSSDSEDSQNSFFYSKRKPQECRKCRNHNISMLISGGHRKECTFRDCECVNCTETNELRESMKIENKHKRRVRGGELSVDSPKSPEPNYGSDYFCSVEVEEEDKKNCSFLIESQPLPETLCLSPFETIIDIKMCRPNIPMWIPNDNDNESLISMFIRNFNVDIDSLKGEFDQYLLKPKPENF